MPAVTIGVRVGAFPQTGDKSDMAPTNREPDQQRQDLDPEAAEAASPGPRRGRRRLVLAAPLLLLVVAAGAWALFDNLRVAPVTVSLSVPEAPRLTASAPDQKVYRIDATRSSVAYDVEEILAGTSHTAHGTTSGIAGDILLDERTPGSSKVGEIVVNVEQLTSDQAIRDNRIRHDFLESTHYPLARLKVTSITGLPSRIEDSKDYQLELKGDLVVKDQARPVTLAATASRADDTLHVKATAHVKLTDWGIGPISLGPLVKTGDEATLTIDATAIDGSRPLPYEVAAGSPATTAPAATGGPSFKATVQPILERNCASCHNAGQAGSDVWKMDTAGDAAKVAKGLGLVTGSGYMPPWPASEQGVPLQHERRLAAADVRAIAAWAEAGGPLDVDPSTKLTPPADNLEANYQIRHDQELTWDEPYQGSPAKANDYRCFVLDPKFTDTTFITGFQFLPDQRPIVHHALGFKVAASMRDDLAKLDAADPGAGWQCYAGMSGPGGAQSPDGTTKGSQLIMGWVPGQRPNKLPEGAGIKMGAGDLIVLQLHYHYSHDAPADRSKMAIEVSHDQGLDEVLTNTYLGPAEIPCAPEDAGAPLCNRDNVLAQLEKDFGPAGPAIANGLMLLCNKTLEDLQPTPGGIASSSCDHRIRRDGEIIGVLGHEHTLGKTFRMTLNPGTPGEKVLLDIPTWDFQWQMVFAPAEKIEVHKGDTLRIECSWDRSLESFSEPRYVTWAEGTEDEMCYSALTVRLKRP